MLWTKQAGVDMRIAAPALPANPGILTGRAPLLEKDPAGQCAISLACFSYPEVV